MIDHAKALEYAQQVKDSEWFEERITILAQTYLDLHQRMQWQPIESAPVNESVLVWVPHAEHYGNPIYRGLQVDMGTGKRWTISGLSMGRDCGDRQPTHWQPLPLPPTQEKAG